MAFTSYVQDPGDPNVFTFTDDQGQTLNAAGPAAMQKAREIDVLRGAPGQPSPALLAAAAPGPDLRTASAEDVIRNALAGNGAQPPPARLDAGAPAALAAPIAPGARRTEAEAKRDEEAQRERDAKLSLLGGKAGNIVAGALGVPALPEPTSKPGAAPAGAIPPTKVIMAGGGGARGPNIGGVPVEGLPAAAATGKVIPAHEQPTGRAEEKTIIPEEQKQQIAAAQSLGIEAQQGLTGAETKQIEQIAGARHEYGEGLSRFEAEQRGREVERMAEMKSSFAKADALSREVSQEPITADRWWAKKGSGEKLLGAIAVALGAAGQSLAHGPNVAADMMNRAIESDIDAQKANLANKREGAKAQLSLVGQYREILGDERAAAAAARKDMLEAAARHIEDVVADTQSEKVKAQGQAAIAALYQHYADADAQLNAYKEHRAFAYVPAQQAGGGGGSAPVRFDIKRDQVVKDASGHSHWIKSGEEGAKVRERLENTNESIAAADEFLKLADNPANYVSPEGRARIRQAAAAMKVHAGKEGDFNVRFSGEAGKMLDTLTGADDPAAITHLVTKGGMLAAVKQYRNQSAEVQNHILGSQGAIQVEPHWYFDPKTRSTQLGYVPLTGERNPAPQNLTQVGE